MDRSPSHLTQHTYFSTALIHFPNSGPEDTTSFIRRQKWSAAHTHWYISESKDEIDHSLQLKSKAPTLGAMLCVFCKARNYMIRYQHCGYKYFILVLDFPSIITDALLLPKDRSMPTSEFEKPFFTSYKVETTRVATVYHVIFIHDMASTISSSCSNLKTWFVMSSFWATRIHHYVQTIRVL
jgi:hypothetical protein